MEGLNIGQSTTTKEGAMEPEPSKTEPEPFALPNARSAEAEAIEAERAVTESLPVGAGDIAPRLEESQRTISPGKITPEQAAEIREKALKILREQQPQKLSEPGRSDVP